MKDILADNFATHRFQLWPSPTLRIVSWNIDRGLRLRKIIDFLECQNADLLILQEVDLNARRTQRVNVAQEIARQLGMNYVFGREFEELTQGSPTSPAYHGQATLSRWPLSHPRLIRFRRQSNFWRPRWFLPHTEPFQERLGGRVALVTQIEGAGRGLTVYNLHLESRGNNDLRLAQLEEVLQDAAKFAPQSSTLLAGDLNFDASVAFRAGTTCEPLLPERARAALATHNHAAWIVPAQALKRLGIRIGPCSSIPGACSRRHRCFGSLSYLVYDKVLLTKLWHANSTPNRTNWLLVVSLYAWCYKVANQRPVCVRNLWPPPPGALGATR